MYYLEKCQLLMVYYSYSNQIHDLIIVFKSKPDSVVKITVINVDARNIVTADLKIVITTTIVKYQIT